jgi:hypothetical protein
MWSCKHDYWHCLRNVTIYIKIHLQHWSLLQIIAQGAHNKRCASGIWFVSGLLYKMTSGAQDVISWNKGHIIVPLAGKNPGGQGWQLQMLKYYHLRQYSIADKGLYCTLHCTAQSSSRCKS